MADIRSMHIEPADNGYMCTVDQMGPKSEPWSGASTKTVHMTPEEVGAHVTKTLGGKITSDKKKDKVSGKAAAVMMKARTGKG